MHFYFYSPVHFEKWDWRNSVEKGIGGSETSHVEMSWRLAARGHQVTTYAPIPDDCPGVWRGTKWLPLEAATFQEPGVWIIYRDPPTILKFDPTRRDQKLWFMMQDWDYPNWKDDIIKRTDRIITLCHWHAKETIRNHPLIKKNMWISSNGIKLDLIEEIEQEKISRDPKRIVYTSSPDRGLLPLLVSYKKAREYVPDLKLDITYGFNNIDVLIKNNPKSYFKQFKRDALKLSKQPGITFHGRMTQPDLYRLFFSAGMWVYETNFRETSCISCMEAQAMGAIPIFSPAWAQGENVHYGVAVPGDPTDPLTHARFAAEIVRVASDPVLQDGIRTGMMHFARERYDWENFVNQWLLEARGKRKEFERVVAFPTQL